MATYISNNGRKLEMKEKPDKLLEIIEKIIEAEVTKEGIPLPYVNEKLMARAIEYRNKHSKGEGQKGDDTKEVDGNRVSDTTEDDLDSLFQIILMRTTRTYKIW